MSIAVPVCRMAPSGLFLAFEGGDGAGKSTQSRLLVARLQQAGLEVVLTREPGGTEVGRAIRDVLLHGGHVAPRAEALLFAADRGHHVTTVVRPALERWAVVITDRFMDSSIAYQGVGRALPPDDVRALSLWATGGLVPHLTVLLDVDPGVGRGRRGEQHDRLESESERFHGAVRQGYLDLARAESHRYLVLDAARPAEELHRAVWSQVAALRPELLGVAAETGP